MAREEIARRIAALPLHAGYDEKRAALRSPPRDWNAAGHPVKVWRAEVHGYLRATLAPEQRCAGARWCGNIGDQTITVTGGLVDVKARICARHLRALGRESIPSREFARQQGAST